MIDTYIFIWIYGIRSAVESVEEILCLLILWPWCIFVIFSHIFSASDQTVFFGFAEWGLPIIYGFLLLLEHLWAFGTYILVYLVGTRGRASLVINFFEDFVAILIMVVRVTLQAIRGVIVGMFHFICREALLVMSKWWYWDTVGGRGSVYLSTNSNLGLSLINVLTDFVLATGSLVIITAIMFLQLIFLIVSVWLFCKCWFISWNNTPLKLIIYKKDINAQKASTF